MLDKKSVKNAAISSIMPMEDGPKYAHFAVCGELPMVIAYQHVMVWPESVGLAEESMEPIVCVGVAYCSENDQYDRKKGNMIAKGRMEMYLLGTRRRRMLGYGHNGIRKAGLMFASDLFAEIKTMRNLDRQSALHTMWEMPLWDPRMT